MEGEAKVTELCERFRLDRRPSSSYNESLPVSTAVCERGLSTINVIATKSGNRLLVKTISNLFFLSLVCPPQAKFEPAKPVREWHHHHDCPSTSCISVKLAMPGTADGDAISGCQVLSRAGSVHRGADQ